jgi:transmembrane sensor
MENITVYLENKQFIRWVFSPGHELDAWWKAFETANPHEKENILLARRILQKLHTNDKELTEDEKIILFTRILKQVENDRPIQKNRKFIASFLKYAAVAILFFSIGALLFYQKNNFNPQFIYQEYSEPLSTGDAKLIRPSGESIILNSKNSVIEHRNDGQVIVNNELKETESLPKKGVPEMNQLIIPYGKTSEIILADGTRVWLNAGSRLIYPEFFIDKNREVFLIGEAYFEVLQDDKKPFVVQTSDIRIRVLGTRFNVSAYPTDDVIETVLTEGKVRLEQNYSGMFPETTEMKPGQMAAFNKNQRTMQIKTVVTDHHTLWRESLLKFESTDLSRVVKNLERYFNIRFKYNDPFLGGIKISGKLELSENRETVLGNVADVASLKISKIGENYYEISRK